MKNRNCDHYRTYIEAMLAHGALTIHSLRKGDVNYCPFDIWYHMPYNRKQMEEVVAFNERV